MVWQQALYLVNLLCKFVPCDYNFPYPDTSLSEPQAFKDLITIGVDGGALNLAGKGWGDEGHFPENDPLVVLTKSGNLRGYWMKVVGGRKIRAYEGVPYAEPPVGYFRFAEPAPKIPWPGLRQANKKGPKCLQFSQIELKQRIIGSEDCLCLNIYTPTVNTNPIPTRQGMESKFPVVIFIHGGGYQVGTGNDYGPSYFLQQDIILVTFNYRVGVFGFLSTGDKSAPGNFGLKDQALAIQWVYNNIDAFNGDPLRITLMGQEAGGASVHLQMMSLKARPFFTAAVSMSGTAFSPWAICSRETAMGVTKHFASKFKCPVHSSEAIISCLRRVDAGDMAKAQIKLLDDLPLPIYLFRPTLETADQGEPPFLTITPDQAYREGVVAKIPFIAGFTEDEGLTYLLPSVFRGSIKNLRSHWNELAADFLDYDGLKHKDEITKKVNWLYFKHNPPLTATIKTFSDALSARYTVGGVHKALQAHSTLGPSYGYMFAYNGKYNLATLAGIKPQEWGVGQGEDLFYLLNSTHFYQGFKKTDQEMLLAKIMVNLFGNFVKKRAPSFTLENGEDFAIWNPIMDAQNMSFLLIQKKIKMIPEPYVKQSVYWESLGLPDTTPFLNTSEHYRDFHFITPQPLTLLVPPQAPPRIYYAEGDKPEIVEIEENEPNSDEREVPEVEYKSLTTSTTEIAPTTTTAEAVKSRKESSEEIFLPPWHPLGFHTSTTTTRRTTTARTTTTTTAKPTTAEPTTTSTTTTDMPVFEGFEVVIPRPTVFPNPEPQEISPPTYKPSEETLENPFPIPSSTTPSSPRPVINSLDLLDPSRLTHTYIYTENENETTTENPTTTTTATPSASVSTKILEYPDPEVDSVLNKMNFNQDPFPTLSQIQDEDKMTQKAEKLLSSTTSSTSTIPPTTTIPPLTTKISISNFRRNNFRHVTNFSSIAFLTNIISDTDPYIIMKRNS